MSVELHFHKLSGNATTPKRGSEYAAGLDLASAETKVIPAKEKGRILPTSVTSKIQNFNLKKGRALVKTDLQVAIPAGCYGRIAPRSGLAYKKGIDVGAGVIDQG